MLLLLQFFQSLSAVILKFSREASPGTSALGPIARRRHKNFSFENVRLLRQTYKQYDGEETLFNVLQS